MSVQPTGYLVHVRAAYRILVDVSAARQSRTILKLSLSETGDRCCVAVSDPGSLEDGNGLLTYHSVPNKNPDVGKSRLLSVRVGVVRRLRRWERHTRETAGINAQH